MHHLFPTFLEHTYKNEPRKITNGRRIVQTPDTAPGLFDGVVSFIYLYIIITIIIIINSLNKNGVLTSTVS